MSIHFKLKKSITSCIYLIRHGERADAPSVNFAERMKIKEKFNPPLTFKGKKQSQQVGKFIYENNLNCKNFLIFTSPFLRCLQTSDKIAEQINEELSIKKKITTLIVFNDLSEILSDRFYDSNILPKLLIQNNENDYYSEFKTKINVKTQINPHPIDFPESREDCQKRFHNFFSKISTSIKKENLVIMIITHAIGICSILNSFPWKNQSNKINFISKNFNYCSMIEIKPEFKHFQLIQNFNEEN